VVVAGDNLIDATGTGNKAVADPGPRSKRLAGQLGTLPASAGYSIVDAGIQGNRLSTDGASGGGVSLLARLDRDVLAEPNVGTVVIDEGLEDLIGAGPSTTVVPRLIQNYGTIAFLLSNVGAAVTVATLTPCAGYANTNVGDACGSGTGDSAASCTTESTSTSTSVDDNRDAINLYLCSGTLPVLPPVCVADLDGAVSNAAAPEALVAGDDAGDHANLTAAGYKAAAQAVTASGDCPLAANSMSPVSAGGA
jgi:hypothetical protein